MEYGSFIKSGSFGAPKHHQPKLCVIVNSRFCYLLKVDGLEIPFQGAENAEYFAEHYHKLGYEIINKVEEAAHG